MADYNDPLEKYHRAVALAYANYRTRLREAQRQMGEANELYEADLQRAREIYQAEKASPTHNTGDR